MGGNCIDYGCLTTPQIHHLVSTLNKDPKKSIKVEDYYEHYAGAFNEFLKLIKKSKDEKVMYIDCADGIGGPRLNDFNKYLNFNLYLINSGVGDKVYLNDLCGAEYVQKQRRQPRNFEAVANNEKCISFDGDADRIIYLYVTINRVVIKKMMG
jgi:phosphoacetylglucosamine mutase